MTICLAALFYLLRLGLKMRARRLAGLPRDVSLLRLHLRLARPLVVLVTLGFAGGLASAIWLRGWRGLESFHGVAGAIVVLLFAATAWYGRAAERGEGEPGVHGALGLVSMLLAGLAAIAGFVLLP